MFNPDISRIITFVCPILGILVAAVTSCYARETSFTLQVPTLKPTSRAFRRRLDEMAGRFRGVRERRRGGWVERNTYIITFASSTTGNCLIHLSVFPWTSVYRGNKVCGTEAIINVVGCVARPLFNPFGVQTFIFQDVLWCGCITCLLFSF